MLGAGETAMARSRIPLKPHLIGGGHEQLLNLQGSCKPIVFPLVA